MTSSRVRSPTPIFVIGMNRSGTKWLSNELSNHPDISCVSNESTGIRETNMLVSFSNKFELTTVDEYIGLIELWAATDFFQRTEVDKAILYQCEERPKNSFEVFKIAMNEFARLQGTNYWLQKMNPMVGMEIAEACPDVKCVTIHRSMKDQMRSNLARKYKNPGMLVLARAVFSYVRDKKILDLFARKFDCPVVSYESLKQDRNAEIEKVLEAWELPIDDKGSDNQFKPNTSFENDQKRVDYFSKFHHLVIFLVSIVANLVPTSWMIKDVRRKIQTMQITTPGTFVNVYEKYPGLRQTPKCKAE